MKILILSAMEEEIEYLVNYFKPEKKESINGNQLYLLKMQSNQIYILNSGIGKVNSCITTSMVLNNYNIDKLISIGTSGALTNKTEIGDFVIADRLAYHDVDVTAFGYEYGQLPKRDKYFIPTNDQWWKQVVERFEKTSTNPIHFGDVITGDSFVHDHTHKQKLTTHFKKALACEMESTAIIHTALQYKVDCYVLRSISDKANGLADVTFDQYLLKVCENYRHLIEALR